MSQAVHDFRFNLCDASVSAPPFVEAETCFEMIASGPPVEPQDVELLHVDALEVIVLWGSHVLHVAHLTPPRDFSIGEERSKTTPCDVFVPSEVLGTTHWPLVRAGAEGVSVVIPAQARGYVERVGEPRVSLDAEGVTFGPCVELSGARRLALSAGARVQIEMGDFVLRVASVRAGKPSRRGVLAAPDWRVGAYFGLSFLTHASLVALFAFFMPPLNVTDDESLDRDRLYLMSAFLDASAERERRESPALDAKGTPSEQSGGGTQAAGAEGSMGTPAVRAHNKRYAVQGPKNNPDAHLAREATLREARQFGIIGMLDAGLAGDPNAPTAPFGRDESLGADEVSARGNMWGDEIGNAFGAGGLGLTSLGEGGGGVGAGVGVGDVGTLGGGRGLGNQQGFGRSEGGLRGTHQGRVPRARPGSTTVNGHLPPEVVQRIVRQNFGRFRVCYQQALGRNPNLAGRVAARFVIGRDGSVSNVGNGGSDLPDSAVVGCVLSGFYGLSFPEPQGGIVTVVYPILFSPG